MTSEVAPARPRHASQRPSGGGPLLAVAGVRPGAGATTLAHALARAAAREWRQPVLLCDGGSGGVAALTGVASARSLAAVARAVHDGQPLDAGLVARTRDGVRVIARPGEEPSRDEDVADGLARVLGDARAAHGLTVVDAGRLEHSVERLAVRHATHVAWVLAQTDAVPPHAPPLLLGSRWPREVLVVRATDPAQACSLGPFAALAATLAAPLALMPAAPDDASVTLTALLGFLRR